jgi:hypothetical protein
VEVVRFGIVEADGVTVMLDDLIGGEIIVVFKINFVEQQHLVRHVAPPRAE